MNRTTVFLVIILIIVAVGVVILMRTTGHNSPSPETAAKIEVSQNSPVVVTEPAKPSADPSLGIGDAGRSVMMKTKMEPSGDNALSASVKCAPDDNDRNWTYTFLGAKSWHPPFPDDSDIAVRIVVKNLGSHPFIIASRKFGDDGFPVPVTENDADYRLREKVAPSGELTVFKGGIGYYFKHWKSFGSLTTVPRDGIELRISIYFDKEAPDSSKEIYLMSTRSAF